MKQVGELLVSLLAFKVLDLWKCIPGSRREFGKLLEETGVNALGKKDFTRF